MLDHVHLCLCVPQIFSIEMVIGTLKGKSAVRNYIREQEKHESQQLSLFD